MLTNSAFQLTSLPYPRFCLFPATNILDGIRPRQEHDEAANGIADADDETQEKAKGGFPAHNPFLLMVSAASSRQEPRIWFPGAARYARALSRQGR